jgi:glycyl-tRNA synthetase beta chain
VPTEPVSVAVALADKIDTLTGFWAIDEKPTGSKDPFALRRAALGVIRLVVGNGIRFGLMNFLYRVSEIRFVSDYTEHVIVTERAAKDLVFDLLLSGQKLPKFKGKNEDDRFQAISDWIEARIGSVGPFGDENPHIVQDEKGERLDYDQAARDLLAFFHDRLKVHLRDQGIRHDVIDAVLAMPGNDDLTLLVHRAEALAAFLKSDDGTNLLQGFKRANNILTQAEEKDGVEYSFGADPKFAEDEAERTLFAALDTAESAIAPAMQTEDFAAAMSAMAALRAPIDAFFEAVQVNTDNEIIRRNRLNLLSRIRQICLSVADLTKIEG